MIQYSLFNWEIIIPRVISKNQLKTKGVVVISGQNLVSTDIFHGENPEEKLKKYLEKTYGKHKISKITCLNI